MPRIRRVPVYQINIAANPHEEGVYPRLLTRASQIVAALRGSDYGKITAPVAADGRPNLFRGHIRIWTNIDADGQWYDIESGEELDPEIKAQIVIPDNAKPNFRGFDYVFDSRTHRLYFEAKNDLDSSVSPTTVLKLFRAIFSADALGEGWPEVAITMVPETSVVAKILALPRLDTLFISVVRPNPDGADDDAAQRVWGKLDQLHAHKVEILLKRASEAERLTVTADYREMAEVAAENGLVIGKGRNPNGTKTEISTDARPKKIDVEMDRGQNFLARLLSAIPGLGGDQNPL